MSDRKRRKPATRRQKPVRVEDLINRPSDRWICPPCVIDFCDRCTDYSKCGCRHLNPQIVDL